MQAGPFTQSEIVGGPESVEFEKYTKSEGGCPSCKGTSCLARNASGVTKFGVYTGWMPVIVDNKAHTIYQVVYQSAPPRFLIECCVQWKNNLLCKNA